MDVGQQGIATKDIHLRICSIYTEKRYKAEMNKAAAATSPDAAFRVHYREVYSEATRESAQHTTCFPMSALLGMVK